MASTAALLVSWAVGWWAVWWPGAAGLASTLGWILAAGAALLAARWQLHWQPVAAAQLAWDGEGWLLDGQPVAATLALSSTRGLLLRLRGAAGSRWLGVSRAEAGPAWHALRVAVQAHALHAAGVRLSEATFAGQGPLDPGQPLRGA